jgi:hypothetical protein
LYKLQKDTKKCDDSECDNTKIDVGECLEDTPGLQEFNFCHKHGKGIHPYPENCRKYNECEFDDINKVWIRKVCTCAGPTYFDVSFIYIAKNDIGKFK